MRAALSLPGRLQGRIRAYRTGDLAPLMALYRKVWPSEFADFIERCWAWKFEHHPYRNGSGHLSLVLEAGDGIAGFVGALPAKWKIGSRLVEGAWLADVMVAPEVRGRAGFALGRAILERRILLMGQPGPSLQKFWMRVTRRRNIQVTRLQSVRRKFGVRGLALRAVGALNQLGDRCRRSRQRDRAVGPRASFSGADAWLPDLLTSHQNLMWRTEAYLDWRFVACPYGVHRIFQAEAEDGPRGYVVLREDTPRVARLVEALARRDDDETYLALLRAALSHARELGKEGVQALAPEQGGLARALRCLGFLPSLRARSEFEVIGFSSDSAVEAALHHSSPAWTITWADSDFDMQP